MSADNAAQAEQPVLIELQTLFIASNREEATTLLDRLLDEVLAVVCPADMARLVTCSHCEGTLVNPPEDPDGCEGPVLEAGLNLNADSYSASRWAPGLPCAICADSEHPGQEMPCAREHTEGAAIHADEHWLSGEDRRLRSLLLGLLEALDCGDPDAARNIVVSKLAELDSVTEQ